MVIKKTDSRRDNSCWKAAAATMLDKANYQPRKYYPDFFTDELVSHEKDIYNILLQMNCLHKTGYVEDALNWYLDKCPEKSNPYTQIISSKYGSKTKEPIENRMFIPSLKYQLLRNRPVAISFSWVDRSTGKSKNGHVVTLENVSGKTIIIGDSDPREKRNRTTYQIDQLDHPNPEFKNIGNGHYFDYDDNHPFIKNAVVLRKKKRMMWLRQLLDKAKT